MTASRIRNTLGLLVKDEAKTASLPSRKIYKANAHSGEFAMASSRHPPRLASNEPATHLQLHRGPDPVNSLAAECASLLR